MSTPSAPGGPSPALPSRRHIAALDGVRGIAILGVLLTHSSHQIADVLSPAAHNLIAGPSYLGVYGVDLFFVLSGFLITGILLDTKESPHYFRNFYARRFLRLFPVYYAYLFGIAVIVPWLHSLVETSMPDYDGNWWWYIFYFSNWKPGNGAEDPFLGHFWSLAVEEQFYLVWPTIVLLVPRRRLGYVCASIVGGAFALRCILSNADVYWNVIYRLTVTRFDTLALGALMALALRSPRWKVVVTRYPVVLGCGGAAAFCAVAMYAGSIDWTSKPIQTVGALASAFAFAGLVAYAAIPRTGLLARILEWRFLTAFGRYSYTIYVIHVLIFGHASWTEALLVRHFGAAHALPIAIGTFLVSNATAFFLAKLSWIYFESQILRYKAKFRDPAPAESFQGAAMSAQQPNQVIS